MIFRTVRLLFKHRDHGVWYVPGEHLTLPSAQAAWLVEQNRAVYAVGAEAALLQRKPAPVRRGCCGR